MLKWLNGCRVAIRCRYEWETCNKTHRFRNIANTKCVEKIYIYLTTFNDIQYSIYIYRDIRCIYTKCCCIECSMVLDDAHAIGAKLFGWTCHPMWILGRSHVKREAHKGQPKNDILSKSNETHTEKERERERERC